MLLGIDFSGDADQWRPARVSSRIWLALCEQDGARVRVVRLDPIQVWSAGEAPFGWLAKFLASRAVQAAAIDAPFSLMVRSADADLSGRQLWEAVVAVPHIGRPFPRGSDLLARFRPDLPPQGRKVFRDTEKFWRERGVNVRSTLWCGPRGGTPFAAACMALLAGHPGPVWPWQLASDDPGATLLCEAFPAAQLKNWRLSHQKYNGHSPEARKVRVLTVEALAAEHGLVLDAAGRQKCLDSADALDAVVCAFSAAAVVGRELLPPHGDAVPSDGWIAVHR